MTRPPRRERTLTQRESYGEVENVDEEIIDGSHNALNTTIEEILDGSNIDEADHEAESSELKD